MDKDQTVIALKKARTSIEKVIRMVEEDKYCIDIMQQVLAVQGLLKSSSEKILQTHLSTCFADGMHSKNEKRKEEMVNELLSVMKMKNKLN